MSGTVVGTNLSKAYQVGGEQVNALSDVSVEVFPGEMVAIKGRNGAGKSSLLHILGCLQRPDSGQVRIDDQDVTQLDDEALAMIRAQKVGFLFQAFNLLPNETVLANVAPPLSNQGLGERDIKRKAAVALQMVSLENRMEYTPGQLSPRQRQYVAIARSLVNDPPVLFADEPTRALDTTSREEVMGMFQKLNDQGRTIVMTTAESGIANHCRRIVTIAEGRTTNDELVSKRRIIPASTIPGLPLDTEERDVELLCPRCGFGHAAEADVCDRCHFSLHLTEEEAKTIEGRLSGTESRWLGVESHSDEGEVPGQNLIDELKEVSFLAGLGSKSLVKVLPTLERQSYQQGSTIVHQGDPADSFYIVRSGEVQVVMERSDRLASPIATLGPKEAFGEMALLTDQPERSFTIVAMSDVELWRLPKPDFEGLLSDNLSLALYFNRLLSKRLKTLQEKVYL